jgi:hypothetical protein
MQLTEATYNGLSDRVRQALSHAAAFNGHQHPSFNIKLALSHEEYGFVLYGDADRPPAVAVFCTPAAYKRHHVWARVIAAVTLDPISMMVRECARFAKALRAHYKGFIGTMIHNQSGLAAYWPFILALAGAVPVPNPAPEEPPRCLALTLWRTPRRPRTPDDSFDCLIRVRFDACGSNAPAAAPGKDEIALLGNSGHHALVANRRCRVLRLDDGDVSVRFDNPIAVVSCRDDGHDDIFLDFAVQLSDHPGDVARFRHDRFRLNTIYRQGALIVPPIARPHMYSSLLTDSVHDSVGMLCFTGFHFREGNEYALGNYGVGSFKSFLLDAGDAQARAKEANAARTIQRGFRKAVCDPHRPLGRRALERSFYKMLTGLTGLTGA